MAAATTVTMAVVMTAAMSRVEFQLVFLLLRPNFNFGPYFILGQLLFLLNLFWLNFYFGPSFILAQLLQIKF